jgi:hypothetical protein
MPIINEATAALGQNTNHMDLYNQFMESAQKTNNTMT